MRARTLALLGILGLAAGCHSTRACKADTVLLSVDWPETTDSLIFFVTVDGADTKPQPVPVPTGTLHGTLELDFSAYPAGHSVTVTVTAFAGDTELATGTSDARTLAAGCDALHVAVGISGDDAGIGDLGDGGGPIGCTSASDCPTGQACDATSHTCTMSCSDTQPCNGGCCKSGSCVAGDATDACALGQPTCGSCAGQANGSACLSAGGGKSCGCSSVTDCPPNQACNMTTHTCGPACDMNTPCNGGCCSAATGGTCQTGTLDAVCGNNGGLCAACSGNQFGHKCVPMTGGGQCGCASTADCPASSTACTASVCVNTCTPTMLCQSGCCSSSTSGTCQPGTVQGACGAAGSVCASCVGNANGSACLPSGACGCTKASDCPTGQACDTTQGKCTTACNSNQQCNGGCCSSASGGTCQTGTINAACGSSGVCMACPPPGPCATYSCNGTSCAPSYVPNGQSCNSSDGDGNPCTSGDHCDGAGHCVGTAYSCPIGNQCTSYQCDGNGGCYPQYAPQGTLCGRGDTCCTGGPEECNGTGSCVSNGCCSVVKCCTL